LEGTGARKEFVSDKFAAPSLDTPKARDVLSAEMLEEPGATSLVDALHPAPGITFNAGERGRRLPDARRSLGFVLLDSELCRRRRAARPALRPRHVDRALAPALRANGYYAVVDGCRSEPAAPAGSAVSDASQTRDW